MNLSLSANFQKKQTPINVHSQVMFKNHFILDFAKKVKNNLAEIIENLKEIDNEEFKPGDVLCENVRQAIQMEIYSLFIPFCEELGHDLDSEFGHEEEEPYFSWMCGRFTDMTRFIMALFTPTAELLEQAIRRNNFDGMLAEYDRLVLKMMK